MTDNKIQCTTLEGYAIHMQRYFGKPITLQLYVDDTGIYPLSAQVVQQTTMDNSIIKITPENVPEPERPRPDYMG